MGIVENQCCIFKCIDADDVVGFCLCHLGLDILWPLEVPPESKEVQVPSHHIGVGVRMGCGQWVLWYEVDDQAALQDSRIAEDVCDEGEVCNRIVVMECLWQRWCVALTVCAMA